jgi:DMSO reductase family type II enzyme molybdopterin subunit
MRGVTRRSFLHGAGALALSLGQLRLLSACDAPQRSASGPAPDRAAPVGFAGWQDVHRQRWTWDAVRKGTHFVNCWYQRGCNWDVYVKQGIVFREEQSGTYPQTNPHVPDFNPRGCQKGACYSERMYDASRLRHPLRRVGARGEGRWRRISWEEGLREVAERSVEVLLEDGPGAITWDPGTANANGCRGLGAHRTGFVLDTPVIDVNCEVGDHHPGALATLGKISCSSSADDLFHADLVLIWGGNPSYTQIPNVHFVNEARYGGARVIVIAPDYNASAIHADTWIPVEPGSDAALGLAVARVMLDEELYDAAFVAEQTDLPLLVRRDDRRFLRQRDLREDGAEDVFYFQEAASGELREAPRGSLALEGARPDLEALLRVRTLDGEIEVESVFRGLRRRLEDYAPEAVEAVTGVRPAAVRDLARAVAGARAASLVTQSCFSKYYQGLEMERAQILVMTLAGQLGRKGAGVSIFPAMAIAGVAATTMSPGNLSPRLGSLWLAAQGAPTFLKERWAGLSDEMALYQLAREDYRRGGHVGGMLYLYQHGGLGPLYGSSARWDPSLPRPLDDYLAESFEKGWQVRPSSARPRILFEVGGNLLRRSRGGDRLLQELLPRLDLLVTLDWRMSYTALHSDIVFPAAGWYEKDDITWATPLAPFAHVTTRAAAPFAESKSDWEFHCLFLKELQRVAVERGIRTFVDRAGEERRLDRVYDDFTFDRRFGENDARELLTELLELTTNLNGVTWDELERRGFERYSELGLDYVTIGNATDIEPNETITANTWHTRKKLPWPTLTRRIQFYIDHPFYLELGEELPVHPEPPRIGGDHPLQMTGQHARWSIHASWRDDVQLLRLQRGGPLLVMSARDAADRALRDGDRARVRNDLGSFEAQVKVSPAVRPGQILVDHAWEPYQFRGARSHQSIVASPIHPLQIAGGYFHLQPAVLMGSAGGTDRGTRVEVEPA